ncbi:DUF2147 domain-containing protein [Aquincola tertiaricarbonis]|uniref:DUF2147 domain-containing protein n=1 Tax=Aquincola tertiaricarbonis TaxID=391953 RepID=A0ABY4SB11_AQUTE|nr:DUF2147 domain-containing protein [Aquincola tertiaricarbonis]URI09654.1 DUF2147 domain-containing protein [Aquincola tertiaricarbonis]
MKKIAIAALLCAAGAAWAQSTPAGLWKTIDDETKQERSLVRISDAGGVLSGRIEKVLDPAKQDAVCDKCEGEDKGKPISGLTIVRNVKAGSDGAVWEGGEILDPNNGKTYKVRLKPVDGGKKLEVRGYIGTPLLGRTQTWLRVE